MTLALIEFSNFLKLSHSVAALVIRKFVTTDCARDRDPYEVKKCMPGNTKACQETQMHAGKWARALIFL